MANATFSDADGAPLEGNLRLLQQNGRYLIEQTTADNIVRYYEASLAVEPGDGSVDISAVGTAPLAEQTYIVRRTIFNASTGTNINLDDVNVVYEDQNGQALSSGTFMSNGSVGYIQSELNGETVYYRNVGIETLPGSNGGASTLFLLRIPIRYLWAMIIQMHPLSPS